MIDLCFHLLQAKGNRLDRKIGNVLKDQDIAFSFRPKDKDLDVQKLPFQVRYKNALDNGYFVLRKKQIRGVTRKSQTGGPSESLILVPWSKVEEWCPHPPPPRRRQFGAPEF